MVSVALASTDAKPADENPSARVIILANADDADSLRIARHYAEVRRVPRENIIAQKMPAGEVIGWREFIATVWEPLRAELVARKWIDAIPIAVTDEIGRKKYAMNGHRISALVVCRGVPLKISHEPEFYSEHVPFTHQQEYRSNAGSVDSELCLLAMNNYNINAFVTNPLFKNEAPLESDWAHVIPVGRLDGPSADDAMTLVDRALAVERTGLIGRAYVDIGGLYPLGDQWLESVVIQLAALGFDTTIDRAPSTFPAAARCDAAVLYFGWYAGDLNGPFALPGFQFPPGTVALHIHSYSAATLHSATAGWTGPLVARGATATVGNVFEPYLNLTHRPDLLLRALARGATLGEAALYSLPELSWQTVLVGDPLYRPFGVTLDEQWRNRAHLPPKSVGYLTLRRMHLLETAGKSTEALELGRTIQRQTPSLALAVGVAQRLQKLNDVAGAAVVLDYSATLKTFPADEWALAREAAQLLAATGHIANAVTIYRVLLAVKTMPAELRAGWLAEAAKVALAVPVPDAAQSAAWEKEAGEIVAPPKK